jgi:3-phenylpropionate/trans-cinnamate dioxygenase alpha subunit
MKCDAFFAPNWLFVAHEDQFRKPGDFFTGWMGEAPVIVSNHQDGTARAMMSGSSCRPV